MHSEETNTINESEHSEVHQQADVNNISVPLFEFTGTGKSLFFIYLVNGIFIALTMGIYSFWATTKVRRFFWSNTRVQGEPLEYTGTGRQLALGFLVGILLLILITAIILPMDLIFGPPASTIMGAVIFFLFTPYAMFRSLRYRLTHTRLHGIPFGLDGSPVKFAGRAILRLFIAFITLGIMRPWAVAKITNDIANNIRYGDKPFKFEGSAMKLFRAAILPMILTVLPILFYLGIVAMLLFDPAFQYSLAEYGPVVMGISAILFLLMGVGSLIWHCRLIRWTAEGLHFENAGFTCTLKPAALFGALLKFLLITSLTFGIGFAWAMVGLQRFYLKQYGLSGNLNLADVHRGAHQQEATGDGIAQAFDFDLAM